LRRNKKGKKIPSIVETNSTPFLSMFVERIVKKVFSFEID